MPGKKITGGHRKQPPIPTTDNLSPDARRVHKALAGRDDVTWSDVRDVGHYSTEQVARIWNELLAAGLAGGRIAYAETGYVLTSQ